MHRFTGIMAFMFTTLIVTGSSRASPVLDANYVALPTQYGLVSDPFGDTNEIAQTFTAVNTGILNSVALYLQSFGAAGNYSVSLTTTVAGSPSGGVTLASTSFLGSSIGTSASFYSFDLSAASADLVAGQVYGIVFAGNGNVGLGAVDPGGYPGGQQFVRGIGGQLGSITSADVVFEVFENGTTTAVPEPGSWLLLVPAAGILVRKRRRRIGNF